MNNIDNMIPNLYSLALNISKGNNIIWFVKYDYSVIRIELESELYSKKLDYNYYKTNINYSSFSAFDNKLIERKKNYAIKSFFLDYFSNGFFFYIKKDVIVYLIKNKHLIYGDPIKKSIVLQFIKNHPEYIM